MSTELQSKRDIALAFAGQGHTDVRLVEGGTKVLLDGREASEAEIEQARLHAARVAPLPDISDRQFGAGLWGDKIITFDECRRFVSVGDIPPSLQAIIDTLPDDDSGEPTPRKDAILFVTGAKTYVFSHPLVDIVREAQGWTPEHLRARWAVWATL